MTSMIRVLLVDDHKLVLDGLSLLLESIAGVSIKNTASDAQSALKILDVEPIDVVLLDINMPGMNGIDACMEIKKSYPHISVLALTMVDEPSIIKKMYRAGASGYLLKNADKTALQKAIYAVHEGQIYYASEVSQKILDQMRGKKLTQSAFPSISRREKQILKLIVDEMTTSEIASKLHISFGTVETHRRNIMNKLGARNTAGMVRMAIEHHLI